MKQCRECGSVGNWGTACAECGSGRLEIYRPVPRRAYPDPWEQYTKEKAQHAQKRRDDNKHKKNEHATSR